MPYRLSEQPERIEAVIVHLGYDLRMARLIQFETQPRLSAKAGVSQSTWSMVENGLAEGVRLEVLARIAVAVGGELVLAHCRHPPDIESLAEIGRVRHLEAVALDPGRRRLRSGPY